MALANRLVIFGKQLFEDGKAHYFFIREKNDGVKEANAISKVVQDQPRQPSRPRGFALGCSRVQSVDAVTKTVSKYLGNAMRMMHITSGYEQIQLLRWLEK